MEVSVEDLDAIAIPPLTSLTYRLNDFRADPRWLPTERAVLTFFLEKVSQSLRSLTMSSESAPSDVLRDSYWPCLRDLIMCGEAAPHLETPYVITLGNMSELRSLKLGLTLRPGVTAPIIWPSGYDVACPWPHLQSFTICHPNLEDEVYRHLPPTLQRLLLCSYPYHRDIIWEISNGICERELQSSLLTASEMLELLGRCQIPDLTELAMEFLADDQESDLLQFLPHAFPRLTSLAVNIYRTEDVSDDTLVPSIARDLAPLADLTTLRMHLGLMPTLDTLILLRQPAGINCIDTKRSPTAAEERHKAACNRAAQTFAETLAPSLRSIFLLHPARSEPHWMQYRIIPGKRLRHKEHSRGGKSYELRMYQYARGIIRAAVEGSDRAM
ncbi:hypothetical protein TRAPUB_13202 [Trametes pubescens]|uniref:F-box domain-containing protein n=1 Tax=Trametes pubescens TaxID=154538 RepID=A0A1M2VRR9_TRAPU|nr:hypothetical protein TRAPUB_13202 [Trametes pubescens]